MKVKKLRILNYKCFWDSGALDVDDAITCIVGANDAGKSTLAECLASFPGTSSFRSLERPPAGSSVLQLELEVGLADCELLAGQTLYFPVPAGMEVSHARSVATGFLSSKQRLHAKFTDGSITGTFPALDSGEQDATRALPIEVRDGAVHCSDGFVDVQASGNLPSLLASAVRLRTFVFKAERPVIGRGSLAGQSQLATNASNLPAILNRLQTHREPRFLKLQEHLREVFPHLEGVDARTENGEAEVWVWSVKKDTERGDLAVRLVDSGTGVGQTLGILAVVVASEPSTIVIDEPQSFLHPGAIRRLFDVLRGYPRHQYIVVTHSPAVITAARPGAIGLVSRTQEGSTVRNLSAGQAAFGELLAEVGARLSDVFGADSVIWVEGRTESIAFPLVIEALIGPVPPGTEILPVRSVDELTGKDVARIVDLYKSIATAGASLLPSARFIFDGEHKARLAKSGGTAFKCLPVQNFETFLLDPDAIAMHMNSLTGFASCEILPEQVTEWLAQNGGKGDDADGAKLLKELFASLSEGRYEYRKTTDSISLTKLVLSGAPQRFDGLVALLKPILNDAPVGAAEPLPT